MKEAQGNLWTYPADIRVITTNGFVKKNGECVMGRGCAKEAVKGTRHNGAWPGLPSILGAIIQSDGNHVAFLGACVTPATGILVSFPVKHNWWERADLGLIRRSAEELAKGIAHDGSRIVMPRPGCGNGQLKWEDVKPVIEPILSDNVVVITF
jgi:hypothetical protein